MEAEDQAGPEQFVKFCELAIHDSPHNNRGGRILLSKLEMAFLMESAGF